MLETITAVNQAVNSFIWGIPAMVCIIGVGLLLSVRTGFLQLRKFPYAIKTIIGRIFRKKDASDGAMTPFQAVCTALAATVGTGNIAGVAGAIAIGGPGAVFWMWCSALLGMCTKFSEVTLAVHFRERNKNGELVGGPMYYIKNGLGSRWQFLAVLYSLFGVLTVFGTGNATQVNTIVTAIDSALLAYGSSLNSILPTVNLVVGVVVAMMVAMVLLGGVKRIGQVTEKLVPGMAVIYIVCALIVVFANVSAVPGVFASIFKGAFNPAAVTGGAAGMSIKLAMTKGVGRGVFSNEAGLGSAPIAHAATSERNPVKQGLYGIFEVFMDTIVPCRPLLRRGGRQLRQRGSCGRSHGGRGLCHSLRRQGGLSDSCGRPAAVCHVHHPRLGALRHALRGVPLWQQDHPPLSDHLLPRRCGRRGRGPDARVGYLRHAQRPHVHPEPHRAAAAEPRGHQGDEGAFRGTEKIIETAARPLFE